MHPVGSKVFVWHDDDWRQATVRIHKKQGWHLLVTDQGKEINRQTREIYETPLKVLDYLLQRGMYKAMNASDLLWKPELSSGSFDRYNAAMRDAKAWCVFAALVFLRLEGISEDGRKRLARVVTLYDQDAL